MQSGIRGDPMRISSGRECRRRRPKASLAVTSPHQAGGRGPQWKPDRRSALLVRATRKRDCGDRHQLDGGSAVSEIITRSGRSRDEAASTAPPQKAEHAVQPRLGGLFIRPRAQWSAASVRRTAWSRPRPSPSPALAKKAGDETEPFREKRPRSHCRTHANRHEPQTTPWHTLPRRRPSRACR